MASIRCEAETKRQSECAFAWATDRKSGSASKANCPILDGKEPSENARYNRETPKIDR